MLTAAELELLTAAVDGEPDVRQQRRLARLLEASPEARRVYEQLQRDAALVRSLPVRSSPADLTGSVLEALAKLPRRTPRRPVIPASAPTPAGVPAWFGFALAASVLFLIGVASYLYFAASHLAVPGPTTPHGPTNLARGEPETTPSPDPQQHTPVVRVPEPDPMQPEPRPVVVEGPKKPDPDSTPMPDPEPFGPLLATKSGERIELRTVEATIPTLHKVQGLEKPRLVAELGKSNAFRLELPTRDPHKAVERLLTILKSRNLTAQVDALAAGRLAKPGQFKSSFLVVLEDILPDELAVLMETLAEADRKGEPKKPNESASPVLPARLVLSRQNKLDHRDLADHLGVELLPLPPGRTNGPLGTDLTRPLADQTAEEIERKLSGGKILRPALVLVYGGPKVLTPSPDVKKYLDSRRSPRAGSLQVLMIFRLVA